MQATPHLGEAQASILANKLAEGLLGGGSVRAVRSLTDSRALAIDRIKILFSADHVNVQSPTATQANLVVYSALLRPGDVVLAPKTQPRGSLQPRQPRHISGKQFTDFSTMVSPVKQSRLTLRRWKRMAVESRPKLSLPGMSAYPRKIVFSKFRRYRRDKVGSISVWLIWLIFGTYHCRAASDPVPYADVATSSTHKTFRGPRGGGIILCRKELAEAIDRSGVSGTQGAPLMNFIASRAVLFKEAMSPKFKEYQKQSCEQRQDPCRGTGVERNSDSLRVGPIRIWFC